MEYQIRENSGVLIVDLDGQLKGPDGKAIRALMDDLFEKQPGHISLNLTKVTFVDSTCIGALVASKTIAQKNSIEVSMYSVSEDIKDLMSMTGMGHLFPTYSGEEEMLQNT